MMGVFIKIFYSGKFYDHRIEQCLFAESPPKLFSTKSRQAKRKMIS